MKKLALPFRIMESSLHAKLTPSEVDYLSQRVECIQFGKKEFIYDHGDESDYIYLLSKGSVKLGNFLDEGKELIKYIVQPGEVFGEKALINNHVREEFAVSVRENVQIWKIQTTDIQKLILQNGPLGIYFTSVIQDRLNNMERRLGSFIAKNARSRIVDFIKFNAETRGKQIGYEILINHKLTHQDIANITGTSRQTVTSVLNELKRLNLIYFNGMGILVRDLAKLA